MAQYFGIVAANYASTPDTAVLDIAGDIDIRARVAPNDWTANNNFMGKWGGNGARSYMAVLTATSAVQLFVSPDGTASVSSTSSDATGFTDGTVHWVRATLDVDNGAGNRVTDYYTSDDGVGWTLLTQRVNAGTTSIFNSASLLLGGRSQFNFGDFTGKLYQLQVYDGINGTLVADLNADDFVVGDTAGDTAVDSTGKTWTLVGSTIEVFADAGPILVDVNPATEQELARPITAVKPILVEVGPVSETELSQPITPLISRQVGVGPVAEAETANPIAPVNPRQVSVGQATEAEIANAIAPINPRDVTVGQAVEAETATPVTPLITRQIAVNPADEIESANPITPLVSREVAVGQVPEVETANPIDPQLGRRVNVGQATETELAGQITPATDRQVQVGTATETESANSILPLVGRLVPVGQAIEQETANPITVGRMVPVGRASERELARVIVPFRPTFIPVGTVIERELIRAITPSGGSSVDIGEMECAILSGEAACDTLRPTVDCKVLT